MVVVNDQRLLFLNLSFSFSHCWFWTITTSTPSSWDLLDVFVGLLSQWNIHYLGSLYRISFLGLVKQIQVMTSQHKLHRPGRIRELVGGFEGRAATLVRSSEGLWGRNPPTRDRWFFLVVNCSGMEKPQFPKGFSMNCWLVEVIGWFV